MLGCFCALKIFFENNNNNNNNQNKKQHLTGTSARTIASVRTCGSGGRQWRPGRMFHTSSIGTCN